MIVKERDASGHTIAVLERRASITGDHVLASGCRGAAARLRADPTTPRACALIDRWFARAEDWAVLHDLRLRIDGHAVQINHVLISDALEVVCLDTRYLACGLEIAEHGACRVIGVGEPRPIASPLATLARNVRKLGTELRDIEPPRGHRLPGLGPRYALRGCVLVDPARRSKVPPPREGETVGVFPHDVLQTTFWKRERRRFRPARDRLPPERLEAFAARLAERHHPSFSPHLLGDDITRVNARTERLIRTG